jgi:hypothetical protein
MHGYLQHQLAVQKHQQELTQRRATDQAAGATATAATADANSRQRRKKPKRTPDAAGQGGGI